MAKQVVGTNLTQEDYERLEHSANMVLTDDEAKALINKNFGFEFSQIELIQKVDSWALDETGRKWIHKESYTRKALYDATDWNYIRFNVKGYQYEFVNGDLYFYED